MVDDVQDYLLMDPRVHEVNGREMVKKMRQNIEIMLHQKKHAIQVTSGVLCVECDCIHSVPMSVFCSAFPSMRRPSLGLVLSN